MKKIGLQLIFGAICFSLSAQVPTYKWVSGEEVSTPSNLLLTGPGPRQGASTFTDFEGNLWVFGGVGTDASETQGYFNDIWKYDRADKKWTWISGLMTSDKEVPSYNNSLAFDGVDDRIVLDDDPVSYHQAFTIEMWFKTAQDGDIISYSHPDLNEVNQGWSVRIEDDRSIQLVFLNEAIEAEFTTFTLTDNEWHHIAFSFTGEDHPGGDELTMYVDGLSVGSRSVHFYDLDPSDNHETMFGASQGNGIQSFFRGQLDEIRFWDNQRTDGEIKSNYNLQLTGNEDGLASYYNFNQAIANNAGNSETTVNDLINGQNGTMQGDPFRDGVFIGEMTKMRVWDSNLSQSEIKAATQGTVAFGDPGLAMAYTFTEGSPATDNSAITTISDLTTINDGYLNNFELTGTASNFSESLLRILPNQFPTNYGSSAVVTSDLDGDTYEDVVKGGHHNQSIEVFINDQTGNLGASTEYPVGSIVRDLAIGFFNDDSFPDFATVAYGANPTDERLSIFINDGAGGFSPLSDLTFPENSEPGQIEAIDVDGDTNDDLLVLLAGEDRVVVHYGDGLGGFATSASFDLAFPHYNQGFLIEDFNDDTFPDIALSLLGNQNCGKIGLMINDQSGGFTTTNIFPEGCLYTSKLAVSDFNNDGNNDIVYVDGQALGSVVGNGDGTFSEGGIFFLPIDFFIREFTLFDVNSDNILDIVASADNPSSIVIYTGDEDGEFQYADKANSPHNPQNITSADLDKNGELDIIVGNNSATLSVSLRENEFFNQSTLTNTLDFDGVDDYIDIPNLKIYDNSFTIEGWIKTEDNGPIFSFGDSDPASVWGAGHFSFVVKDERLGFLVNGQPEFLAGEGQVKDGEWHHVAAVIEIDPVGNEIVTLYLDGDYIYSESGYDFDTQIDNGNVGFSAKLGYSNTDFKNQLGTTGLAAASNWTEGIPFPEKTEGRAYAAEWSDGETIYTFGGQGINGIYNSLWSRKIVASECPSFDGLTYTYTSTNPFSPNDFPDPFETLAGSGVLTETGTPGQYTFTDFSFGILQEGYSAGDAAGPEIVDLCNPLTIVGGDQFGFTYSTTSPIVISEDGTSMTFSWINSYNMQATTTITLDAGTWPNIDKWELLSGSTLPGDLGNYGTLNVSDPANSPPARFSMEASIDQDGNVWIFGGAADDPVINYLNDLWKYDPVLNEWTWVSGGSTFNESPVYGTMGVSDPANVPGARSNHSIWTDQDGGIWIFGGYGVDDDQNIQYLNDLWKFDTQTLEWTWVNGSNQASQAGVYGTIDLYDANNVPGARSASLQWVDSQGIVWIFGGEGTDKFGIAAGYLNDLWSYDPSINQWAWHSGSDFKGSTGSYNQPGLSSTEYVPGARWHSGGWVGEDDRLWLFGGYKRSQLSTSLYNDFWNYSTTTKEWTWLSGYNSTANIDQLGEYGTEGQGSNPHPGGRNGALAWTDNEGNFWMLGGEEFTAADGFYNDLWKYEPQKGSWSYINGNTEEALNDGVYGSKGIGSSENDPKSRWHGASWTGKDGKLWFFGGINYNPPINNIGWLNDLWFYDPESNVYTWMGGSSEIDASGVYGIKGEASSSHVPGARSSSSYWSDEEGNFWLFGGYESFEYNNDLWKFNPNTLEWTWVSGNDFQNSPGIYGEIGVPDPSNSIGARRYTDGRIDQNGIVWVFGGDGHDINAQRGGLNDLWKYDPESNIWTWVSGSQYRDSAGNYGEIGVESPDNVPPPRYGHGTWIDDVGNVWIFGGFRPRDENGDPISQTLNDLWKFDVRTNMWTWIGGSEGFTQDGVYGTKGEYAESNVISSRQRSEIFLTTDKSLWLFGGRQGPIKNDFWEIKFTPGLPFLETAHAIDQTLFSFNYDEAWSRSFRVQVAESDDFSDPFYDQFLTEKEATISDILPGTIYYYRANAINEIGESGFTEFKQVLTLPATPTFASLALAVSDLTSTQVTIDWTTTPGILDGYYFDVSEDSTFTDEASAHEDFVAKEIAVAQQQEIQNLTPGTRYYIRLRSFNDSGLSPFSQTVPFLTKPETPTFEEETVVTEITQSSVLLTWNEVPEVLNGYRLTVSTADDEFLDAASFLSEYDSRNIPKSKNSLGVVGLTPGTEYYASLVSVNLSGESDPSEKITILTTPESPVFALEGSISATTQTDATFTWQAPNGQFEGFLLEVSTDFTFANTNLMLEEYGRNSSPKNLPQTQLEETVAGLTPGQTYFVRVRTFNASGQSPNSNIISFTTVPRAPQFNTPGNISQNSASLSWGQTSGTDLYLLDVNTSADFGSTTPLFNGFPIAVPFEVLSDLEPGIRYYARVQSSNASGSSGEMTPADYSTTNFITIPSTPILEDPDQYNQDSFRISWPAIEGADTYLVDASDNFFQTFLNGFSQLEVSTPEVIITGLSPGNEYQVRVGAKNESGTSPNASVFDVVPLPETPIARDASNISSSVFTTNWDPSDGAEEYVLEVSLDNFQTFHFNETLSSSNPVQMTDLTGGSEYRYRVKAVNASGESPYSNVISIVAQNNSQSLAFASLDFQESFAEEASSTTVTVNLSGGIGSPTIAWRHRGLLSEEWSALLEIEENSNTVQFEISSFMLDDIGVEFEVYANDGITFLENLGNMIERSFSESQSEKLPALVFSEWQMISVPFILEQPEVVNVFNELGGITYKKGWRIMHYENGAYLDGITGFNNIEIGKGYWFNALNEVTINVGAGTTNTNIPFELTLREGWNQIGNPFNASINWNQILVSGNLLPIVDGLFVYDTEEKEFRSSTTLSPFSGAFVWADQETTVEVFPSLTGRTAEANNEAVTKVDGLDWLLPINLKIGGTTRRVAGVGMNHQASESKDSMDELVPPRFENYLEMFTTKAFSYPYFSTDIVPVEDSHVWSYELTSNVKSGPARLQWDNIPLLNNTLHVWLVDEDAGRVIKMTEQSDYSFNFNAQNNFSIHYSTDPDYQVLPANLSLGDAFPNPVSSKTNITVLLPASEESYSLELVVYDLQGKKVKTITNGEYFPGLHLFELDVKDQAQLKDGIYIYQLDFEGPGMPRLQKKLVITK